jgi:ribosomal protein S18 acetylase RimI-like enzyme
MSPQTGRAVRIRTFAPADHAAALALWQRTPGVGLSEADAAGPFMQFLARNPGTSFCAWQGDELVGTVLCGHDGRRGLIHHLVTAPAQRRSGIASALLAQGLAALRAQGIHKCHLLVYQDNAAGLGFWERVGAVHRHELALLSIDTGALTTRLD